MSRMLALFLLLVCTVGAAYEWGGPARRGVRSLKVRHYDEALDSFRAARPDHPESAALRFDEALAHLGKGEIDSSLVQYREAMRMKGDGARAAAAYNLANGAMHASRFREAADLYRESLRIQPRDLDAKRNMEEALRLARGSQPQSPSPAGGGGKGPQRSGAGSTPAGAPGNPREKDRDRAPAPPRGGSGEFSRDDAERWLEALEAERRGSRREGRAQPQEETGRRDW